MKKGLKAAPTASSMRYVLIIAMVILLAFAIMYVYNVHKMAEHFESQKYTVIYLYSSTCPYCVKFNDVWTRWKQSNVQNKLVETQEYDKSDPKHAEYAREYGVSGYPTVVVLKPDGSLSRTNVGYVDDIVFATFISQATSS